jgi:hypothetical protein
VLINGQAAIQRQNISREDGICIDGTLLSEIK